MSSRNRTPTVEIDEAGVPSIVQATPTGIPDSATRLGPNGSPLALGDARSEAIVAENSQFVVLKAELFTWEAKHSQNAGSRERAFYCALRSMLQEILRSGTTQQRTEKLAAAHAWFVKNHPSKTLGPRDASPTPYARAASASPSAQRIRNYTNFGHRSDFFSVYSRDSPSPLVKARDSLRAMSATPAAALKDYEYIPRSKQEPPPVPLDSDTPEPGEESPAPPQQPVSAAKGFRRQKARPKDAPSWKTDPWARRGEEDGWGSDDSMERLNDLADEQMGENELLRSKWRASEAEQGHWQVDIQDAMMEWSLQRSRIEEEIVRRQEATRYASPYPNTTLANLGMQVENIPQSDTFITSDPRNFVTPEPPEDTAADPTIDSKPIWLSPYCNADDAVPVPAHQRSKRPISAGDNSIQSQIEQVEACVSVFERTGRPLQQDMLERALVMPQDKSYGECVFKLPQPGAHLLEKASFKPPAKGRRGKGKNEKGSGRKKKAATGVSDLKYELAV